MVINSCVFFGTAYIINEKRREGDGRGEEVEGFLSFFFSLLSGPNIIDYEINSFLFTQW